MSMTTLVATLVAAKAAVAIAALACAFRAHAGSRHRALRVRALRRDTVVPARPVLSVIPAKAGIHFAYRPIPSTSPPRGVIPAQAGIQSSTASLLDPGLRRDDATGER